MERDGDLHCRCCARSVVGGENKTRGDRNSGGSSRQKVRTRWNVCSGIETDGYRVALNKIKNIGKSGGGGGADESAMSSDKSKYDIGTHTHAHTYMVYVWCVCVRERGYAVRLVPRSVAEGMLSSRAREWVCVCVIGLRLRRCRFMGLDAARLLCARVSTCLRDELCFIISMVWRTRKKTKTKTKRNERQKCVPSGRENGFTSPPLRRDELPTV